MTFQVIRDYPHACDWYFVFDDGDPDFPVGLPFWRAFTCEGFRHVFAIRETSEGVVLVNPHQAGLFVTTMPFSIEQCVKTYKDSGHRILYLPNCELKRYIPRGIQSCVSICKSLAGIKAWNVITPRQFYEHLLKVGATDGQRARQAYWS